MSPASLTSAQRTQLRGLGQTMPDSLQVGREGATVTLIAQLERVLAQRII
jgi:RNA-binding protein YhbY